MSPTFFFFFFFCPATRWSSICAYYAVCCCCCPGRVCVCHSVSLIHLCQLFRSDPRSCIPRNGSAVKKCAGKKWYPSSRLELHSRETWLWLAVGPLDVRQGASHYQTRALQ
jgi:hypothetical protein